LDDGPPGMIMTGHGGSRSAFSEADFRRNVLPDDKFPRSGDDDSSPLKSWRHILVALSLGVLTVVGIVCLSRGFATPRPDNVSDMGSSSMFDAAYFLFHESPELAKVCPQFIQAFDRCQDECVEDTDCSTGHMCCRMAAGTLASCLSTAILTVDVASCAWITRS